MKYYSHHHSFFFFFLYQRQEDKTIVQLKKQAKKKIKKVQTEIKLHPIFPSVKYTCVGRLHVESIPNSYKNLSAKVNFSTFNGINKYYAMLKREKV